eukprot:TRINITY_DN2740_c0_g1_i6.p1 TRINITY_DN2740_c0_g1~~TRINITY_DN2740_c0_g1_i6.p1  ORF type:complete len:138 (+),score=13.22 TRINITY_DN2740_c0_g1_i6:113-526(+)
MGTLSNILQAILSVDYLQEIPAVIFGTVWIFLGIITAMTCVKVLRVGLKLNVTKQDIRNMFDVMNKRFYTQILAFLVIYIIITGLWFSAPKTRHWLLRGVQIWSIIGACYAVLYSIKKTLKLVKKSSDEPKDKEKPE